MTGVTCSTHGGN